MSTRSTSRQSVANTSTETQLEAALLKISELQSKLEAAQSKLQLTAQHQGAISTLQASGSTSVPHKELPETLNYRQGGSHPSQQLFAGAYSGSQKPIGQPQPQRATNAKIQPSSTGKPPQQLSFTIPTTNSFQPLTEQNDGEDMQIAPPENNNTPKPPPIFVKGVENYASFIKDLSKECGGNFNCKSRSDHTMVLPSNIEAYRAIDKYLKGKEMEHHSYQLKQERAYRVVIRHLHPTTPPQLIKEELEERGFPTRQVTNVQHPVNKTPLPLFFVDLEPGPNNADIFQLKHILYTIIMVEEPRKRRTLVQCKRCQQLGHTKAYCFHKARCVKCAEEHSTDSCTKSIELPPKCVLCKGNPQANYRGCVVYKELQRQKRPPPVFQHPTAVRKDPQPSHPIQEPLYQPSQPQPPLQHSYAQAVACGSVAPLATQPTISSADVLFSLNSFLNDFKSTITPLINLLTTVITQLLPRTAQ